MLGEILSFLSHYPNFFADLSPVWWAVFVGVCLWQAALSWSVYRQTGMRSYVGATLGNLLLMAGGSLAPLVHTVLQVVLLPGPLLLAGFAVLSLSDARSWFSPEARDKFYLIRHGGLRLRLLGRLPPGFVHRDSVPASWVQGVVIGTLTLLFLGLVYSGVWQAYEREGLSNSAFGWITATCGLVVFHCLALLICGLLFGSPLRKHRRPEDADGSTEAEPTE